eukprot:g5708.t1
MTNPEIDLKIQSLINHEIYYPRIAHGISIFRRADPSISKRMSSPAQDCGAYVWPERALAFAVPLEAAVTEPCARCGRSFRDHPQQSESNFARHLAQHHLAAKPETPSPLRSAWQRATALTALLHMAQLQHEEGAMSYTLLAAFAQHVEAMAVPNFAEWAGEHKVDDIDAARKQMQAVQQLALQVREKAAAQAESAASKEIEGSGGKLPSEMGEQTEKQAAGLLLLARCVARAAHTHALSDSDTQLLMHSLCSSSPDGRAGLESTIAQQLLQQKPFSKTSSSSSAAVSSSTSSSRPLTLPLCTSPADAMLRLNRLLDKPPTQVAVSEADRFLVSLVQSVMGRIKSYAEKKKQGPIISHHEEKKKRRFRLLQVENVVSPKLLQVFQQQLQTFTEVAAQEEEQLALVRAHLEEQFQRRKDSFIRFFLGERKKAETKGRRKNLQAQWSAQEREQKEAADLEANLKSWQRDDEEKHRHVTDQLLQQRQLSPVLAFHGTHRSVTTSISEQGFLRPGDVTKEGEEIRVSSGSLHGQGIYLSPSFLKAHTYAHHDRKGVLCMFASLALPGKPYQVENYEMYDSPQVKDGFDSHISPDGREFIVFAPSQVLPCLLLTYHEPGPGPDSWVPPTPLQWLGTLVTRGSRNGSKALQDWSERTAKLQAQRKAWNELRKEQRGLVFFAVPSLAQVEVAAALDRKLDSQLETEMAAAKRYAQDRVGSLGWSEEQVRQHLRQAQEDVEKDQQRVREKVELESLRAQKFWVCTLSREQVARWTKTPAPTSLHLTVLLDCSSNMGPLPKFTQYVLPALAMFQRVISADRVSLLSFDGQENVSTRPHLPDHSWWTSQAAQSLLASQPHSSVQAGVSVAKQFSSPLETAVSPANSCQARADLLAGYDRAVQFVLAQHYSFANKQRARALAELQRSEALQSREREQLSELEKQMERTGSKLTKRLGVLTETVAILCHGCGSCPECAARQDVISALEQHLEECEHQRQKLVLQQLRERQQNLQIQQANTARPVYLLLVVTNDGQLHGKGRQELWEKTLRAHRTRLDQGGVHLAVQVVGFGATLSTRNLLALKQQTSTCVAHEEHILPFVPKRSQLPGLLKAVAQDAKNALSSSSSFLRLTADEGNLGEGFLGNLTLLRTHLAPDIKVRLRADGSATLLYRGEVPRNVTIRSLDPNESDRSVSVTVPGYWADHRALPQHALLTLLTQSVDDVKIGAMMGRDVSSALSWLKEVVKAVRAQNFDVKALRKASPQNRMQMMREKLRLVHGLSSLLNSVSEARLLALAAARSDQTAQWLVSVQDRKYGAKTLRRAQQERSAKALQEQAKQEGWPLSAAEMLARLAQISIDDAPAEPSPLEHCSRFSRMTAWGHLSQMVEGARSSGLPADATVSDLLYAYGQVGFLCQVERSEAAIINPWQIKVTYLSADRGDSATAMCALDAGAHLTDSLGRPVQDVLVVRDPRASVACTRYLRSPLYRAYLAVLFTRNPELSLPSQGTALDMSALVTGCTQLMSSALRSEAMVCTVLDLLASLRWRLGATRAAAKQKAKGEVEEGSGYWVDLLKMLSGPTPGKYMTEAPPADVVSLAKLLGPLLALPQATQPLFPLPQGAQTDNREKEADNRPRSFAGTGLAEVAMALMAEAVSRDCRVFVKLTAQQELNTGTQAAKGTPASRTGTDIQKKKKVKAGSAGRPADSMPTSFDGRAISHKLLKKFLKVKKESIIQPTEDGKPDPDPAMVKHSSEYDRRSILKHSSNFFARPSVTNVSPQNVVACLELAHALHDFSRMQPAWEDELDSGNYSQELIQHLLAEMSRATMGSFIQRYLPDNAPFEAKDVQIALFAQGLRYHDSKSRRHGLPSLLQPVQETYIKNSTWSIVLHDLAREVRALEYGALLAEKKARLAKAHYGRLQASRLEQLRANQLAFLRTHSGAPNLFSEEEVAFMNAKRPKYDQLIRLETGLLKHHCTFPQCPSYLVNLATAADRMTELDKKQHHTNGTRHGLFRHLKWFSVPDNKYRGSCHLTAWSVFKSRGNTPDACNELQRKLASKPPDYVEALLSSFERMGRHPVDQLRVASSSSAHSSGQPLEDDLVEADSKTGASSTSSHASAAASSSSSSSRRAGVYMAVADETDLLPPNLARQGSDEFKRIMLGAGKPAPARAAVTSVTLARQAQPGPRRSLWTLEVKERTSSHGKAAKETRGRAEQNRRIMEAILIPFFKNDSRENKSVIH